MLNPNEAKSMTILHNVVEVSGHNLDSSQT
jgi:hypothetical protein